MTVFSAIFRKPAKARERLRRVSVTNSQGVTRVKREEFAKELQADAQRERLGRISAQAVAAKG